ncbi:hypothetical protein JCM14713_16520 [Desulfomicrobium salsuginis]
MKEIYRRAIAINHLKAIVEQTAADWQRVEHEHRALVISGGFGVFKQAGGIANILYRIDKFIRVVNTIWIEGESQNF